MKYGLPWSLTDRLHLPMQERRIQALGEESPGQEMATYSCVLAGEISQTEELGRLTPWGCKESDTI